MMMVTTMMVVIMMVEIVVATMLTQNTALNVNVLILILKTEVMIVKTSGGHPGVKVRRNGGYVNMIG